MDKLVLIVVDVALWGVIHAGTGYAAHRLSDERLSRDGWWLRPRRWERDGRFWTRTFRVNRWKHRLPEAGAVFDGGYDKRSLGGHDDAALQRYVRETRRAELGHVWALACTPIFFLFNPPLACALMVVYAIAVNAPCAISARSNRLRLQRVLTGRAARAARRPG